MFPGLGVVCLIDTKWEMGFSENALKVFDRIPERNVYPEEINFEGYSGPED